MLYITLMERSIERCMDEKDPKYLEIIKRSRRTITSFSSEIIPQKGQTLHMPDGTAYDVVNVVLQIIESPNQIDAVKRIICEVVKNSGKKSFTLGNFMVEDDWPIITAREFDEV